MTATNKMISTVSRQLLVGTVLMAAVLYAGIAQAQYSGYYIGLFNGDMDFDSQLYYPVDVTPPSSSFPVIGIIYGPTEGETGLDGLVVGYGFNDNFEVQIGYMRPEEFEDRWAEPGFDPVKRSLSASGFNFGGVAKYPVTRYWQVYGTFGFLQLSVDVDVDSLVTTDSFSYSQNSSGLYYGAGTLFKLTRKIGLSLEYKKMSISAGNFFDKVDLEGLTVGLQFNF